jgi:hypothetical protein
VWQALRSEVHPAGIEIVTVCIEARGAEAARPFIEAAHCEHPALIDVAHATTAEFGVLNVPNGVWIDEHGTIVRPAEPAWPGGTSKMPDFTVPKSAIPRSRQVVEAIAGKIVVDRNSYAAAIRDWARHGAASTFVLSPEQVIARSIPRPPEVAEAAAHFELGQHFWASGERAGAIAHFRAAHRLQPDNWAYKRQAWSLVSAEAAPEAYGMFLQGPLPGHEEDWPFDSDFLHDVQQIGPGEYYPQTISPGG